MCYNRENHSIPDKKNGIRDRKEGNDMKLAEALILRADLQTRLGELRNRLELNAKVQEGEKPAEDPADLMKELDDMLNRLEDVMARINLTNADTITDGTSLTEKLARRECLMQRISMLRSLLNAASSTVIRNGRMEVKIYSTVNVAQLQKQVDQLSEELRLLDTAIQGLNWTTDLK